MRYIKALARKSDVNI